MANDVSYFKVEGDATQYSFNDADAETAIAAEVARAKGVEGTLSNLTTSAKTNLVAAINEVDADIETLNSNISTYRTFTTGTLSTVTVPSQTSSNTTVVLFTATEAGLYSIDVHVSYPSNASGFRRVNLSTMLGILQVAAVNGYPTNLPLCQTIYLSAGTTVNLYLMQNSGSDMTVTYRVKHSHIKI